MRILLAEDEVEMSRAICTVLNFQGFEVDPVYDGEAAVELAERLAYDCMVFDIMMPKMDGISALKQIRASGNVTPVLMLTAKAEVDDRVEGLDSGADDYLTKPFSMKELVARIRSMTRRKESYTPTRLQAGNVTLNTEELELRAVNSVRLGGKESAVMEFLMLNIGKELETKSIFDKVWGDEPDADQDIVWIYISYLRSKLAAIGADIEICGEQNGSFSLRTKS